MPKGKAYDWSESMHRFCNERRHMLRRELASELNQAFSTDRSFEAIRNFCKRSRYHTGRSGLFVKDGAPHNKGKSYCRAVSWQS